MELIQIGRDIIIGTGFAAKHWSGPVLFGPNLILLCPNATHAQVVAGHDSGAAAGAIFGALGGLIAGAAASKGEPTWQSHVVMAKDLPDEITTAEGWKKRRAKLPVILIPRESIANLSLQKGKIKFKALGDSFVLGLGMFGKSKIIDSLRRIGWDV